MQQHTKNFFLDHPVFSIVVSVVIFLVGIIGLTMLPVDQYPQIVPRWCVSPPLIREPTPRP